MTYDIIVTRITNPRARPVVARHLAAHPEISLEKATSMLETMPVLYMENVSEQEASQTILHLRKIGVDARIRESEHTEPDPKADQPTPVSPPKTVTPRPVHHTHRAHREPHIIPPPILEPKKNTIAQLAVLGGAILLLGVVIYLGMRGERFRASRATALKFSSPDKSAPGKSAGTRPSSKKRPATPSGGNAMSVPSPSPNNYVSAPQRSDSRHYADSARTAPDQSAAIRFYKIAISFNKYNIDAWYGLVGAYRDLEMYQNARDARAQMREIFGDNVASIGEVIGLFGKPLEVSMSAERTLRVDYASHTKSANDLTGEAFRLIRALRTECSCQSVSLHARSKDGGGVLVYHHGQTYPASQREFERDATITFLE